jgi:glucosamine--fructose-6-phosphate aminotransferase (isomerizing)
MKLEDYATYREITGQPKALAAAVRTVQALADPIRTLWEAQPYRGVFFIGCGSTYYLSLAAASIFQRLTGMPARGIPASELLIAPQDFSLAAETAPLLLVAVSRSGATTETLRAVKAFQAAGRGGVVTITCQPGNELSRLGQLNLFIPEAQEQSVAQTQAFSAMWIASCALCAAIARRDELLVELQQVPELARRIIKAGHEQLQVLGGDPAFDRVYFLGSGLRYGLACEGSLKMKEMTLTHSEAFHFLEFRHGPQSMATSSTLVVALMGDDDQHYEADILYDLNEMGVHLLILASHPPESLEGASLVVGDSLGEIGRSVLYLPPLQLLAFGRAMAKEQNPDRPHNLEAVVCLDQH